MRSGQCHRCDVHPSQIPGRSAHRIARGGCEMEIREALTIVRKLADGVHPETGEVLQEDCLYNHPHAVRALHRAIGALEFDAIQIFLFG